MKILKNLIFSIIASSILSSCAGNPLGEFKRSASNKMFDMTGFESAKRRPLYNKKYITKAKKNVARGSYDEDSYDPDEDLDIPYSSKNISMYKNMLRKDGRSSKANSKNIYDENDIYYDDYGDITTSRRRVNSYNESKSKDDMEMEILEIKEILKKTREEVSKAKCPYKSSNSKDSDSDDSSSKKSKKKSIATEKAVPGAMTQVRD